MASWPFAIYINNVVKEVNVNMIGRGPTLVNADGRDWNLNSLMLGDDTARVADS